MSLIIIDWLLFLEICFFCLEIRLIKFSLFCGFKSFKIFKLFFFLNCDFFKIFILFLFKVGLK